MREVRTGKTCLLSSVCNVLAEYDHRFTEEILFLFGRGNRIDYKINKNGGEPNVYIGHDSVTIVETFFRRFNIPQFYRFGCPENGTLLDEMRDSLTRYNPVIAWVDMAQLGYMGFSPPSGSIHAVTIEAEASGMLSIVDCYAPVSLYSEKIRTHRYDVAFDDFVAWESTDYARHHMEFQRLAEGPLALDEPAIRQELVCTSSDYLYGSDEWEATCDVLQSFADDLPNLLQNNCGSHRQDICNRLAYNIRYFGILWSREFVAAALTRFAREVGDPEMYIIADEFRAVWRQWKHVMLAILKLGVAEDWCVRVERTRSRIRALIRQETDMYKGLMHQLAK